jgi:hypothetical protein
MMTTVELAPSRPEDRGHEGPAVDPVALPTASGARPWEGDRTVRVLVIFEGEYRAYGEAIAGALGDLRPRAEVVLAQPTNLAAKVARVSPHLVISSQPKAADPARTPAWVELPHEPGLVGRVCFGGECIEAHDLNLEDLLAVIDKTEFLVRA